MTDELDIAVAETALKNMFDKGYLCICTIDKVARVLGRIVEPVSYERLSALHCVHFDKMPPELVEVLPALVAQCIGAGCQIPQFSLVSDTGRPVKVAAIGANGRTKKRSLLGFIRKG